MKQITIKWNNKKNRFNSTVTHNRVLILTQIPANMYMNKFVHINMVNVCDMRFRKHTWVRFYYAWQPTLRIPQHGPLFHNIMLNQLQCMNRQIYTVCIYIYFWRECSLPNCWAAASTDSLHVWLGRFISIHYCIIHTVHNGFFVRTHAPPTRLQFQQYVIVVGRLLQE